VPYLKPLRSAKETLKFTTIREFGGGLNVVDNDLNLSSKFATVLDNMYRGQDGSMRIRFGTELFGLLPDGVEIINMAYYNSHIIVVVRDGDIYAVNGQGAYTVLFSTDVAAALPGAPSKWDETLYATFCEAKGFLKIDNGVNKPLVVDTALVCQYLVDEATGSNLFVPVARASSVHDRYLVTSGDPFAPTTLSITAIDTIGTFEGAPPPNDGVNIDLSSRVRKGSATIRGHASFRDKLVVFFDQTILIGTLGIYDSDGNHTPQFDDAIELWGARAHNTILPVGDDMLFADLFGVPSLTRALFTGSIRPDRVSALIDPLITKQMSALDDATLEDRVFAVYNITENQYMLFVPNESDSDATTETVCYAYTVARQSKDRPWSRFRGWNFRCGCRSVGGNVFFAKGNRVYLYGSEQNPILGDENGYADTWSDLTTFDDYTGFDVPLDLTTYDETRTGLPFRFDWQFPWADFGKRLVNKFSKLIQVDAFGLAEYNLDMFVDNFVIDQSTQGDSFTDDTYFDDDSGWIPMGQLPYIAALTTNFVANDFLGYGGEPYGAIYGGGRPSWEMLYQWETKFRLAKFRIWGDSREDLRVVSLSIAYAEGSVRR
jgi:hypothetical protein